MNIHSVATPVHWQVDNHSPCGGEVMLAGWDFGGSGPLALLHHANGMCAATWAPVAQRLRQQYRVYAIDGRGHGDSQALAAEDCDWAYYVDDLIDVAGQLLRSHGQSAFALGVGSSMGGIVAAAAQAKAGDLFTQIVMLDPPIHPNAASAEAAGVEFASDSQDNRAQLVEQTLRRRAIWPNRATVRQAWQHKPLFAAWHADAFELYLQEGLRDTADGQVELKCAPAIEAHIFATTGSLDVLEYAPKVQVPVHFVHAAEGFFDEHFFRGVAKLFPRARFSQMLAGHMLPLEKPAEVADLILNLPDIPAR